MLKYLLGLFLSLFTFGHNQAPKVVPPTLNFSTGICDQVLDAYKPPTADVLKKDWLDTNTLQVETYLKTYCAGAVITGDIKIQDANLTLLFDVQTPGPVTSCLCAHKLIYKISRLDRKDYKINLAAK